MRAPWGAERAVEDEAAVQAARGMEALDQGERAAVERQDGGPLRLHLGRRPGELLGHRVPVRPRGARELALARPREVGELEEISQRGGQGGVHRRECGGVEVLAEGTRLVEQEVGEVEASGVEHELAVGTRATEVRKPPVDGGVRQRAPLPLLHHPLDARRVLRNFTEDDATMQERFTVGRAALELNNTTSTEVSEAKSVHGKRKA